MANEIKPEEVTVTPTPAATTATVEAKKSSALPKVIIILVVVMCLCLLCIGAAYFVFINFLNRASSSLNATDFNSLMNAAYNSDNSNSTNTSNTSNSTYNYTDPETGVDFNIGTDVPSTFPSDVPIYAGATASFSSSDINSDGKQETSVTFTMKGSVADVVAFYKAKMDVAGYDLTSEVNLFGNVMTFENSKREVIVSVIGSETEDDVILSLIATDK